MSYTSVVTHPPETRYCKVTDDFYSICFDAPDASCAAALLNLFVYWTDYRMNTVREEIEKGKPRPEKIEDALWFFRHEESIQADLFNIWGVTKLRQNRKWLVAVGLVEETIQEHESGRQNVYRVNVPFLQFAIQEAWEGAVNSTDGYVIFNGWDALNSPTKKNSSKKKKETTTPKPPVTPLEDKPTVAEVVSPSVVEKSETAIDTPVNPAFSRIVIVVEQLEQMHRDLANAIKDWMKEYTETEIVKAVAIAVENRRNGTKIYSVAKYLPGILTRQRLEAQQKPVEPPRVIQYVTAPPPPDPDVQQSVADYLAKNRPDFKSTRKGLGYHDDKAAGQ